MPREKSCSSASSCGCSSSVASSLISAYAGPPAELSRRPVPPSPALPSPLPLSAAEEEAPLDEATEVSHW